jgi:hypothetical protein
MEEIAKGNRHLFTDMTIDGPGIDYDWHPFPVIKIDMREVSSDPNLFAA